MKGSVYLIPTVLYENALETIPPYVLETIKKCNVFFVENERTTRRFFKSMWREMVIEDYQWFAIHKAENDVLKKFIQLLRDGKNVGIVSEAGCPGVADPGQVLIEAAQNINAVIKPLVGPSSILLALMASGMNGQKFQFVGYLPIDNTARRNAIKETENESLNKKSTQIFIETPFRNNQLIKEILASCRSETRLCIAVDITGSTESIKTKTVEQWRKHTPDFHKRLAIFLLNAT